MLLRLRKERAIVDEGAAGDAGRTIVNEYGGIHKVAVCVEVTHTQLGELARGAAHRILMAFGAGPAVEYGPEAGTRVVHLFVNLLVEGVTVARGLGESII